MPGQNDLFFIFVTKLVFLNQLQSLENKDSVSQGPLCLLICENFLLRLGSHTVVANLCILPSATQYSLRPADTDCALYHTEPRDSRVNELQSLTRGRQVDFVVEEAAA